MKKNIAQPSSSENGYESPSVDVRGYEAPTLEVLGSVTQMTEGGAQNSPDGGGPTSSATSGGAGS